MARTLDEVDAEIERLKKDIENVHGTECEVYARIVGYYRSVKNWNNGKKEEYRHRKQFDVPTEPQAEERCETCAPTPVKRVSEPVPTHHVDGSKYRKLDNTLLFFYRPSCVRCPEIKTWLKEHDKHGVLVNCDTDEGRAAALEMGVISAPTVIAVRNGDFSRRAHTVDELAAMLAA